jgi:hypothetical protein
MDNILIIQKSLADLSNLDVFELLDFFIQCLVDSGNIEQWIVVNSAKQVSSKIRYFIFEKC